VPILETFTELRSAAKKMRSKHVRLMLGGNEMTTRAIDRKCGAHS